jgi:dipeptidyl aminopeptidase/acylaminoacyl peptidase
MKSLSLSLAALLAGSTAHAARPVTYEDIVGLRRPSDPQLSPGGERVAFVVTEWNRGEDRFSEDLYIAEVGSGRVSRLPLAPGDKRNPRWSPDGRSLAFLTDHDGTTEIDVTDTLHASTRRILAPSGSIDGFEWSPDGTKMAFVAGDGAKPPTPPPVHRPPVVASEDIEYEGLWLADLAAGSVRRLPAGARDVVHCTFSPDGGSLACLAQPSPLWPEQTKRELYIVPLGGGDPRRLTANPGEEQDIAWAPDGAEVAYLEATDGNPLGVGPPRIHVVPTAGGTPKVLAPGFDGYIRGLRWQGSCLFFTAGVGVAEHLYRIASPGGAPEALTSGDGVYHSITTDRPGRALAAIHESPSEPPEVWFANEAGQPFRALTALNPQAADWSLGKVEVTRWKSADGVEIEGLVVYPLNYVAGRRYPTVLYVHGGPESANVRDLMANWGSLPQVYAAAGFVVLMPNFRGSSNYGGRFALGAGGTSIAPEEGSFADCMTGLDRLIERGIADAEHLAIKGWSYGGYFTAWAVGHTTRFKAAVEGAGDTDLVSYFGTASINPGFDLRNEHPYDDPALWQRRAPLSYASKVRTPCLILQGEKDRIVPMGQSQEFYKALQHFGVTTELVIYPNQPHELRVPSYQIDKMRRELEWIKKYAD